MLNLDKTTKPTDTAQPLPPIQSQTEQPTFNLYQATLTAQPTPPSPLGLSTAETNLINYNHLTYALYAFSFFTAGLTWIIPIVMNYVKRDEARGTWLESHFDWQIKTFWYSIFVGTIAIVMLVMGFGGAFFGTVAENNTVAGGSGLMMVLGFLLGGVSIVWHLYRLVRGWIALSNRRAIP